MRRSATSLSREERLRTTAQINRVFALGRSVSCQGMRLAYAANDCHYSRICVIPARGHRTAVERNRTKRIGREVYRAAKLDVAVGYDLAMICYPGAYSFVDRMSQFHTLLGKARLDMRATSPA